MSARHANKSQEELEPRLTWRSLKDRHGGQGYSNIGGPLYVLGTPYIGVPLHRVTPTYKPYISGLVLEHPCMLGVFVLDLTLFCVT